MTTKEFLIKKNEIIKRATGITLIPENQIIDEPKVKLEDDCVEYLSSTFCPYCVPRMYCNTCPMYKAGNQCTDTKKDSTWYRANSIWRKKATEKDKEELKHLIREYNKDILLWEEEQREKDKERFDQIVKELNEKYST